MSITSLDIIAQYAEPIPALLTQENVLDVCVNPDGVVWVNRLGPGFRDEGVMTPSDAELLLSGIATEQGCELNAAHPILETTFPLTGDRIDDFGEQGVLTGMSDPLNAKCHRTVFLDHVCGNHMNVIRLANLYYQNILLVGPVGSSKTTFGNARFEQTLGDRVVAIEDTPELHGLALRASRVTNEPRSCASAAAFEISIKRKEMKIKRSFKDSQTDQMPILFGQNRSRALAVSQNFQLLVAAGLSFLICGVTAFAQFSSTTTAVDPTAGAQSWRGSLWTAFCISWPAQLSFASAGKFFRLFSSRLEGIMEIALGLIVFGLILKRGLVELELPTKEESEL